MGNRVLGVGIPALKSKEEGKLIDVTIDFSVNGVAAADTESVALPANTYATDVFYQVVAASTDASTRTLDIGDTAVGATAWVSNLDMKTAGVLTRSAGTAYTYTAADQLLISHDHALTTGKLRVVVYGKLVG
jgi:hypothetical protein